MGFFLLAMAVVFAMLTSMPTNANRLLAVVCVVWFILLAALDRYKKKAITKTLVLEAYILSLFLLYQLLKQESTAFYFILSKISSGFCAFVGVLMGKPISMSITYSGLDVTVFFLIASIAAAIVYKRKSWSEYLLYVLAIAAIWGFYIGLWTYLAESSLTLGLNLVEPITGPLDYRLVLFVLLSAFYFALYQSLIKRDAGGQLSKTAKWLPVCLLTFCVGAVFMSGLFIQTPVKNGVKQVVFLDTGIDFSVPEYGKYGLDQVGMFGVLPRYLNLKGYNCLTVDALSGALLAETDVLVVFNPVYSLDEDSLSAVWRFVENGGSVLAVGDHTGEKQIRFPLNAILEPVDISFNFDSAIPFKSLWLDDFQLKPSPIFKGVADRQIQIVVGASLEAGDKVKPLVIGKTGYSDLGAIENVEDGYLGDMRFNRGERIGDLLLAAQASYGKGKFMVFGDTTHFQNTVIAYSYPFIDNIFAYLSDNGMQCSVEWKDDGFFKASCVIDMAHLEVLGRDKSGDAVDGLIAGALRAGLLPYLNQNETLMRTLESDQDLKLVIIIEPAISFSFRELSALQQFMETGGTVMVCAGYDSPAASKDLLTTFGFSFDNLPLGRIAPDRNPEMAFWDACPVLYQGSHPDKAGPDVKSLMEIWGYSTIAYKTVGTGGLYVLADPDFLKNKNLESVDTYRQGNVLFLDTLLTTIVEERR